MTEPEDSSATNIISRDATATAAGTGETTEQTDSSSAVDDAGSTGIHRRGTNGGLGLQGAAIPEASVLPHSPTSMSVHSGRSRNEPGENKRSSGMNFVRKLRRLSSAALQGKVNRLFSRSTNTSQDSLAVQGQGEMSPSRYVSPSLYSSPGAIFTETEGRQSRLSKGPAMRSVQNLSNMSPGGMSLRRHRAFTTATTSQVSEQQLNELATKQPESGPDDAAKEAPEEAPEESVTQKTESGGQRIAQHIKAKGVNPPLVASPLSRRSLSMAEDSDENEQPVVRPMARVSRSIFPKLSRSSMQSQAGEEQISRSKSNEPSGRTPRFSYQSTDGFTSDASNANTLPKHSIGRSQSQVVAGSTTQKRRTALSALDWAGEAGTRRRQGSTPSQESSGLLSAYQIKRRLSAMLVGQPNAGVSSRSSISATSDSVQSWTSAASNNDGGELEMTHRRAGEEPSGANARSTAVESPFAGFHGWATSGSQQNGMFDAAVLDWQLSHDLAGTRTYSSASSTAQDHAQGTVGSVTSLPGSGGHGGIPFTVDYRRTGSLPSRGPSSGIASSDVSMHRYPSEPLDYEASSVASTVSNALSNLGTPPPPPAFPGTAHVAQHVRPRGASQPVHLARAATTNAIRLKEKGGVDMRGAPQLRVEPGSAPEPSSMESVMGGRGRATSTGAQAKRPVASRPGSSMSAGSPSEEPRGTMAVQRSASGHSVASGLSELLEPASVSQARRDALWQVLVVSKSRADAHIDRLLRAWRETDSGAVVCAQDSEALRSDDAMIMQVKRGHRRTPSEAVRIDGRNDFRRRVLGLIGVIRHATVSELGQVSFTSSLTEQLFGLLTQQRTRFSSDASIGSLILDVLYHFSTVSQTVSQLAQSGARHAASGDASPATSQYPSPLLAPETAQRAPPAIAPLLSSAMAVQNDLSPRAASASPVTAHDEVHEQLKRTSTDTNVLAHALRHETNSSEPLLGSGKARAPDSLSRISSPQLVPGTAHSSTASLVSLLPASGSMGRSAGAARSSARPALGPLLGDQEASAELSRPSLDDAQIRRSLTHRPSRISATTEDGVSRSKRTSLQVQPTVPPPPTEQAPVSVAPPQITRPATIYGAVAMFGADEQARQEKLALILGDDSHSDYDKSPPASPIEEVKPAEETAAETVTGDIKPIPEEEEDEPVICRMCERSFARSELNAHSDVCMLEQTRALKLEEANQRIKRLRDSAMRRLSELRRTRRWDKAAEREAERVGRVAARALAWPDGDSHHALIVAKAKFAKYTAKLDRVTTLALPRADIETVWVAGQLQRRIQEKLTIIEEFDTEFSRLERQAELTREAQDGSPVPAPSEPVVLPTWSQLAHFKNHSPTASARTSIDIGQSDSGAATPDLLAISRASSSQRDMRHSKPLRPGRRSISRHLRHADASETDSHASSSSGSRKLVSLFAALFRGHHHHHGVANTRKNPGPGTPPPAGPTTLRRRNSPFAHTGKLRIPAQHPPPITLLSPSAPSTPSTPSQPSTPSPAAVPAGLTISTGISAAIGESSAMSPSRQRTNSTLVCSRESSAKAQRMPSIDDFDFVKPISRGAFGRVYLARKKATKDLYAIKVMRKKDMINKNMVTQALAERRALSLLSADWVVQLYYAFHSSKHLFLVMEYLIGGDLAGLLRVWGVMDEDAARFYTAEIACAIDYLHRNSIVHRDIKPDNVILCSDGHIKLSDFGLSQVAVRAGADGKPESEPDPDKSDEYWTLELSKPGHNAPAPASASNNPHAGRAPPPSKRAHARKSERAFLGTPDYLAPELLLGAGNGLAVDWWALGVCLFEFLCGYPPFTDESPEAIFRNILNHAIDWPDDDGYMGENAQSLIRALLHPDPASRAHWKDFRKAALYSDWDLANIRSIEPPFVPMPDDDVDTSYFESCQRSEIQRLSNATFLQIDTARRPVLPAKPADPSPTPAKKDPPILRAFPGISSERRMSQPALFPPSALQPGGAPSIGQLKKLFSEMSPEGLKKPAESAPETKDGSIASADSSDQYSFKDDEKQSPKSTGPLAKTESSSTRNSLNSLSESDFEQIGDDDLEPVSPIPPPPVANAAIALPPLPAGHAKFASLSRTPSQHSDGVQDPALSNVSSKSHSRCASVQILMNGKKSTTSRSRRPSRGVDANLSEIDLKMQRADDRLSRPGSIAGSENADAVAMEPGEELDDEETERVFDDFTYKNLALLSNVNKGVSSSGNSTPQTDKQGSTSASASATPIPVAQQKRDHSPAPRTSSYSSVAGMMRSSPINAYDTKPSPA